MSWFRMVVCDWSRSGVLLRGAGYDMKAPWQNTKLNVQNCSARKYQGEVVGGWGKGMRIKGEKIKETEIIKGEGKWREIRQKTREFDKRYGKKKVNWKIMNVRKMKLKMRNNKMNKERTVGDVRLSSSITRTCMAWRRLQSAWPYRVTKERHWESSACKSHVLCSDMLPPATHWRRLKCVCNNRHSNTLQLIVCSSEATETCR
jgi:hypothetical protein